MSKIRLHGSSSGYTEIAPVAASGNNTLTLPNDGTIISKDSNGAVGVTSITVGTGVTIGDGRVTCTTVHGSAASLTQIPAANIVGVCTSGLTKTGGFSAVFAEAVVNSGDGSPSVVRSTGFGSLTDNGSGDYTLALSTAQSDADYTVVGAAGYRGNGLDAAVFTVERNGANGYERANTTTAVNFGTVNDNFNAVDAVGNIHIACMRG